ncbi:hypothetical protein NQ314_004916 [Rhamnusium bicolor]|uniref:Uncharacterized protein n=1 Tax=Rhamnusium bicolor TaxID=1586634 RepID=A0AAV8ZKJ7_9CUCU|nr:hypothetical protein NQ314_004916 [Rhamnusium bicolor]
MVPLSPRPRNISPPPGVASVDSLDSNLHTFREALVTSPLSCIASRIRTVCFYNRRDGPPYKKTSQSI